MIVTAATSTSRKQEDEDDLITERKDDETNSINLKVAIIDGGEYDNRTFWYAQNAITHS